MLASRISLDVRIPEGAEVHDDVTIGTGALLTSSTTLEAGVRVGARVVFVEGGSRRTVLRQGARVDAAALIGAGVEVGRGACIEPGAVVLNSVPANAIVRGNPAQIVGYTEKHPAVFGPGPEAVPLERTTGEVARLSEARLRVRGASLYHLPWIKDLRGSLTVGELDAGLPFLPQRYFIVFDVPSEELRGEHAHRECHQVLVCVRGSCRALLDDGHERQEVVLDSPNVGLHMPPMVWGTQYRYTRDAMLLVLASHPYSADDYIRTYDEFLAEVSARRQS